MGCGNLAEWTGASRPPSLPEYRQKVGLYVHDEPERFHYPGSASLDVADLMSFHVQHTLPYTAKAAFGEIFQQVETKKPGPKIELGAPEEVGYFEIKIVDSRFDFPDPGADNYRAEIQILTEFKTPREEVVWKGIFTGKGIGYSDPNVRMNEFGAGAANAVEDAFQNAIYEMQDGILESATLRDYFRWYQTARKEEEKKPKVELAPKEKF